VIGSLEWIFTGSLVFTLLEIDALEVVRDTNNNNKQVLKWHWTFSDILNKQTECLQSLCDTRLFEGCTDEDEIVNFTEFSKKIFESLYAGNNK